MRKLLIIFTIFFLSLSSISYSATGSGPASVLKVIMKKMELCTGYTGGDFNNILTNDFCHNPVVIGSGDKEVDIASVGAGQAAAAYGTPTLLPLGETYTHMRTTIGKKFIIKSGSIMTWDHINLHGEYDFEKIANDNNKERFDIEQIKAFKLAI